MSDVYGSNKDDFCRCIPDKGVLCTEGIEYGPRALGHRSILSDARNPNMKVILNEKIKLCISNKSL